MGTATAMALLLNGCSMFHSKDDPNKKVKCAEPAVASDVVNRPPLKVPAGMTPPNTAGAVQIPTLNEPEIPRADTDPCLTSPPDYGTPDSGKR
ncbi:MAG TPA: hypothetical protein VMI92_08350 [Steroidobacteraceae bacterium]|nr:hypothetical protein [Steroidobacteraceae bacterium]